MEAWVVCDCETPWHVDFLPQELVPNTHRIVVKLEAAHTHKISIGQYVTEYLYISSFVRRI